MVNLNEVLWRTLRHRRLEKITHWWTLYYVLFS